MSDLGRGKGHWSEIGQSAPSAAPRPPVSRPSPQRPGPAWAQAARPRRARGGRRLRLVLISVVGVLAIGAAAYWTLDYTGVFAGDDAGAGMPEELQVAAGQMTQEQAAPTTTVDTPALAPVETAGAGDPSPGAAGTTTTTASPNPGPTDASFVQLGTPRSWALATSALLARVNGMQDDLLAGVPVTARNAQVQREFLTGAWNVHDREDLLAALEWLDTEGQRKAWDEFAAYLAPLTDDQLEQMLSQAADDPDMTHRIELVRDNAAEFGSKSLKGFDYSRYVCMCRWGYLSGYLEEDEAWDLIMPVAAKLQGIFSSWQEMGQNYLVGREFWSYQETLASADNMDSIFRGLLTAKYGPWIQNPWDMPLGVAGAGTI